jgi:hypothetical protein
MAKSLVSTERTSRVLDWGLRMAMVAVQLPGSCTAAWAYSRTSRAPADCIHGKVNKVSKVIWAKLIVCIHPKDVLSTASLQACMLHICYPTAPSCYLTFSPPLPPTNQHTHRIIQQLLRLQNNSTSTLTLTPPVLEIHSQLAGLHKAHTYPTFPSCYPAFPHAALPIPSHPHKHTELN